MSRIDELVREMCPDGVEYKPLGDVGEFIRGSGLQKSDLREQGFPAVHYGQIHTYYGVWAEQSKSFTDEMIAAKLRHAKPGDLLIATTSEDNDAVAKATAWVGDTEVVLSGDAYIYRHTLEPKYMAYFFQSTMFHDQKRRFISGTKVRRISAASLAKIKIPVPPRKVQREIVLILDHFTQLEMELEAELEAELEVRRDQYHYYMSSLFDDLILQGASMVALRDVGHWYGGGTPSKSKSEYWTDGSIPWISPKDMAVSTIVDTEDHITEEAIAGSATKLVPTHAIAIVARSSILNHTLPVAYLSRSATLNQDMKAVTAASGIRARYLFHAIRGYRSDILRRVRRAGGSVASLDSRKLWDYKLPVPKLDAQERVIELLDHFESLTNDMSVGLPAELVARRKQYEHYRDRLLTFKELSA
ncbi:restriction endonuclease subunit S [Rothia sp. AR01]|uniref:Restriction endonuclease subunit S n=1 Tax=Rothia santali TaxID=2949643 RepID=A0A9X2KKQ6_9MICC|nr:restriction endonuclease subunit S [Rothia santali]MCP3425306.1 restriction endonuclease subunit S [Rothia santali]